ARTERTDRGSYAARPERTERTERSSYPARDREYSRDERPVRRDTSPEGDRSRNERPARREGFGHDGERRRPPHHDRTAYQPHSTRSHVPGHASGGVDPEAERIAADSWTKSTRRSVSTGPVDVAPDNAFTALGLPERLVERLARDGITEPFPIQTAAIPDGLAGRDVLGRGRTGSGKTLAFGLAMITRLADGTRPESKRPRSLILVPTRELAMQVSDALEPF